jgi:hypothetical protein
MMDKSKTPLGAIVDRAAIELCRGVLDLSIIQLPFSITKWQTLIFFIASAYLRRGGRAALPLRGLAAHAAHRAHLGARQPHLG